MKAAEAWSALPGNARGAIWIILAGLCFACMGATVKVLGARLDPFQIAFFRCFLGLLFLLPFLLRSGGLLQALRTRRPGRHIVRVVLGVIAMFCGFYAVTHMPLADVTTLGFTQPLFMIPLAALVLGEQMRRARWLATLAGFAGVLLMIGPGGGEGIYGLAAVAARSGAFIAACVKLLIKQLAVSERPITILAYFGVVSTLLSAVPALVVWRTPSLVELVLLSLVGGLGVIAQAFTIRALGSGEASAVMPFDYVRLLFATAFGFALFGDLPGLWTLAGAAVIVASTLFLARVEMRAVRGVP